MPDFNRILGVNSPAMGVTSKKQTQMIEAVIDLADAGNAHVATDSFQLLPVPAGTAVIATGVEVLRTDTAGNSGTLTVRLNTTARGSATAPTALGYPANLQSTTLVAPVATNAQLNLLVSTGAVNCRVRLWAILQDITSAGGAPVNVGSGTYIA